MPNMPIAGAPEYCVKSSTETDFKRITGANAQLAVMIINPQESFLGTSLLVLIQRSLSPVLRSNIAVKTIADIAGAVSPIKCVGHP